MAACARLGDEEGFTIVEAIVGFVIVVVLFLGLGTALVASLRQQNDTRLQQQAAALGVEHVEFGRSLGWTELELSTAPGPEIPYHSGGLINGSFFELDDEPLVVDSGSYTPEDPDPGRVEPRVSETIDGHEFTVYQYVTDVDPGLRRLIIVLSWEASSGDRTHVTGTLVSEVGAT